MGSNQTERDSSAYLQVYRALESLDATERKRRGARRAFTTTRALVALALSLAFIVVSVGLVRYFSLQSRPEDRAAEAKARVPDDTDTRVNPRIAQLQPKPAVGASELPGVSPESATPAVPRGTLESNGVSPKAANRAEGHQLASPHSPPALARIQRLERSAVKTQTQSSLPPSADQNQQNQKRLVSVPNPAAASQPQLLHPEPLRQQPALAEEQAWSSLDRTSETSVRNFLNQYPGGAHAPAAQDLLSQLWKQEEARRLNLADDTAWKLVSSADNRSLEQYLSKFPAGRHAGEAREGLSRISSGSESREAGAVIATLTRYCKAWDAKDVANITALRPGLGRHTAKEELVAVRSISMHIQPTAPPRIQGNRATVECIHQVEEVFDDGTQKRNPGVKLTYVLVKRHGDWLIAGSR